jgi:hypothetical protein
MGVGLEARLAGRASTGQIPADVVGDRILATMANPAHPRNTLLPWNRHCGCKAAYELPLGELLL